MYNSIYWLLYTAQELKHASQGSMTPLSGTPKSLLRRAEQCSDSTWAGAGKHMEPLWAKKETEWRVKLETEVSGASCKQIWLRKGSKVPSLLHKPHVPGPHMAYAFNLFTRPFKAS